MDKLIWSVDIVNYSNTNRCYYDYYISKWVSYFSRSLKSRSELRLIGACSFWWVCLSTSSINSFKHPTSINKHKKELLQSNQLLTRYPHHWNILVTTGPYLSWTLIKMLTRTEISWSICIVFFFSCREKLYEKITSKDSLFGSKLIHLTNAVCVCFYGYLTCSVFLFIEQN